MSAELSPIEVQISEIWRGQFPALEFTVDDNLFDLMADSLRAVLVLTLINCHFGIRIPVTALLTTPFSVRGLAGLVELYLLGTLDEDAVLELLDEVEGMSDHEASARVATLQGGEEL